ncbi:glycosyltransferase family 2 protein [Cobetia sp. L2A1]|uniref:glycosyltransferase family 2 protein n=1 Tax=Cobetia sp. L2A1 TaxID=2686360 RepID=UPI001E4A7814|nr:glycosyltransferase family 2 protein [Cobetia sp. L2A1]
MRSPADSPRAQTDNDRVVPSAAYIPRDMTRRQSGDWMLSLVVPVMNEEDTISLFLEAIEKTLGHQVPHLEILFVDDGSSDGTLACLEAAVASDSRVRYLSLTRNFGKEAAMSAGIEQARGDAVVPMDVDLQDPPEVIIDFIAQWQAGYDMVYGVRAARNEDTATKRQTAGLFYRVFNRVTYTEIPRDAGDFRLLDRRVVEALRRLPERNRFMKGLFSWPGYRSVGVTYQRPARAAGITKFNYWKLWNFALDGVVSFSTWPLRVWTYLGVGVAGLAFLYILVIISKTVFFGIDAPGYASLMIAVLFFGGMQLISIGVLGEYLGRLFMETKQRPLYLIDHDSLHDSPSSASSVDRGLDSGLSTARVVRGVHRER